MVSERDKHPCSLVTGGAGFIGSHVARHCLEQGHTVIVLDDLSGGFADQVPEGARLVVGSVTDVNLVAGLFRQYRFDYVYHLAAYAAEVLSHYIRRFNYEHNLLGAINLINEAVNHRSRCFVFTSTIGVYGKGQLPMSEDMVPMPEDPYGISKYAVELDLAAAFRLYGLPYIIFRPHNVYGKHQNLGDPYRNVLGIFMNQIMAGRPLPVFGDGEQTRAFSYIDDVAPHIARSVHIEKAYNQVFNIGAIRPYTVNHLARVIIEAFGVEARVEHLPAREEVYHVYPSLDKAIRLLNAEPRIGLEEGVRRMVAWARQAGSRASKVFTDIEVSLKLPPYWASLTEVHGK